MNNKDGSNEIHLFSSEGLGSLLIEHKEKKKNLQEENIISLASNLMGEDSPFLDNLDEKIKSLSSEDFNKLYNDYKKYKVLEISKNSIATEEAKLSLIDRFCELSKED